MVKRIGLIVLFSIIFLSLMENSFAGTIKLRWDPVYESSLAGYKIYYGYESQNYTFVETVSKVTTHTLTDLNDCMTYYIAVTSYDYYGNESEHSNEVSGWPRPVINDTSPSEAEQGDQNVLVTFSGTNFDEGSKPGFDSSDIALNNYYINDCGEMIADISIEESPTGKPAKTGLYSAWISNSNNIKGYSPTHFEIKLKISNLDVNNDAIIDIFDYYELAICWGTQEGDEYYDPSVDFNGDGWIDGEDLALLLAHYREYV